MICNVKIHKCCGDQKEDRYIENNALVLSCVLWKTPIAMKIQDNQETRQLFSPLNQSKFKPGNSYVQNDRRSEYFQAVCSNCVIIQILFTKIYPVDQEKKQIERRETNGWTDTLVTIYSPDLKRGIGMSTDYANIIIPY